MYVTISIVNHNHGILIKSLLSSLPDLNNIYKIIITNNNIDDTVDIPEHLENITYIINNVSPKGFGANHNQAFFKYCDTDYFCVLNPDVLFHNNPFPQLLAHMKSSNSCISSTLAYSLNGEIEDNFRFFPTPLKLFLKCIGLNFTKYPSFSNNHFYPEWVAGLFMLIKSEWFLKNHFDTSFFMYYEDIDLCLRCWRSKNRVTILTSEKITHDARRDSHKKLKFFFYHIKSIIYFFYKHLGRFPKVHIS